jgi:hypothetical protein
MNWAAFADKSTAESLHHFGGGNKNTPKSMSEFAVVRAVDDITVERNGVSDLLRLELLATWHLRFAGFFYG